MFLHASTVNAFLIMLNFIEVFCKTATQNAENIRSVEVVNFMFSLQTDLAVLRRLPFDRTDQPNRAFGRPD